MLISRADNLSLGYRSRIMLIAALLDLEMKSHRWEREAMQTQNSVYSIANTLIYTLDWD
ncbi:hypothetical protein [Chamaesiphon polymorphus]|uniref:hypothetical protein n=1 Tax=Chamaesiphon polymorphus TaxID=2107691 RepID=UPI0015E6B3FE|nr:hypothetical protein [Chamaesiphon polymorphus]